MTPSPLALVWIDASDVRMHAVHALRHEALFAPFGLARDDRWDDAGHDREHLVAIEAGSVVGYASLLLPGDGTGHVRQVSVSPGHQRRGVGAALMREVEAEARRLGLGTLWLNARHTAEAFYHRVGYRTVSGRFPSGRTGMAHIRMELPLGD